MLEPFAKAAWLLEQERRLSNNKYATSMINHLIDRCFRTSSNLTIPDVSQGANELSIQLGINIHAAKEGQKSSIQRFALQNGADDYFFYEHQVTVSEMRRQLMNCTSEPEVISIFQNQKTVWVLNSENQALIDLGNNAVRPDPNLAYLNAGIKVIKNRFSDFETYKRKNGITMIKILKQYDNICWYPSAGNNIEAIQFWSMNIGNTIIPKLYIFTDYNYIFTDNQIWIDNEMIVLPNDYEILEHNLPAGYTETITPNTTSDELDHDSKGYKALAELGLVDLPNLEEPKIAYYTLVKTPNALIIFINSKNEDFYNYCIEHQIQIDGLLLNKHWDNELFDEAFENTVIPALSIKEGLVNNHLTKLPETHVIRTNLSWASIYNIHNTDKITYCNYLPNEA